MTVIKNFIRWKNKGLIVERKGFEMSIRVVLAIVLGVLFISAYWGATSGYFDSGVQQAKGLAEALP